MKRPPFQCDQCGRTMDVTGAWGEGGEELCIRCLEVLTKFTAIEVPCPKSEGAENRAGRRAHRTCRSCYGTMTTYVTVPQP